MRLLFISCLLLASTLAQTGRPRPCICMELWDPVCASGVTYGNSCKAQCDGQMEFTAGECPTPCDGATAGDHLCECPISAKKVATLNVEGSRRELAIFGEEAYCPEGHCMYSETSMLLGGKSLYNHCLNLETMERVEITSVIMGDAPAGHTQESCDNYVFSCELNACESITSCVDCLDYVPEDGESWCAYSDNGCELAYTMSLDVTGAVFLKRQCPDRCICTREYNPVCVDRVTFSNPCEAECEGHKSEDWTMGECPVVCEDDDAGLMATAAGRGITLNRGCANMLKYCDHKAYGPTVKAFCPVTCGECDPEPETLCRSNDDCDDFCNFDEGDYGFCEFCSNIMDGCANDGFDTMEGQTACIQVCEAHCDGVTNGDHMCECPVDEKKTATLATSRRILAIMGEEAYCPEGHCMYSEIPDPFMVGPKSLFNHCLNLDTMDRVEITPVIMGDAPAGHTQESCDNYVFSCEVTDCMCTKEYVPVCVKDVTFANTCLAECVGHESEDWTMGECACMDNDAGLAAAAADMGLRVKTCRGVSRFCNHKDYGATVKGLCPMTCGQC